MGDNVEKANLSGSELVVTETGSPRDHLLHLSLLLGIRVEIQNENGTLGMDLAQMEYLKSSV